jgi:hypothetical protein
MNDDEQELRVTPSKAYEIIENYYTSELRLQTAPFKLKGMEKRLKKLGIEKCDEGYDLRDVLWFVRNRRENKAARAVAKQSIRERNEAYINSSRYRAEMDAADAMVLVAKENLNDQDVQRKVEDDA